MRVYELTIYHVVLKLFLMRVSILAPSRNVNLRQRHYCTTVLASHRNYVQETHR